MSKVVILDETLIGEQIMKVEDKPKSVVKTNNEVMILNIKDKIFIH